MGIDNVTRGLVGYQGNTVDYKCGHCSREVGGPVVAENPHIDVKWLGCPSCAQGSVLSNDMIIPAPLGGQDVRGLPEPINGAYGEARKSISSKSYTACEIMCRKILMYVAVHKGAPEGESFAQYVDYLRNKGHITGSMEPWVDKIRNNGNEATHEIKPPDFKRANLTLQFTALLLKNVYETEELMKGDPAMGDDNDKKDSARRIPWLGAI